MTGGSSGIGLAVACGLAARGSNLWLVARRKQQLEEALERVRAARKSAQQVCEVIAADVSDPDQAQQAVSKALEQAGNLDFLINSAGVVHPDYFPNLSLEQFHWMMDINYFGTLYMTRAVLPSMLARHSGHIINISSMAAYVGLFGYTAYSASKFAVRGFSDALRLEMKQHGIRVSVVFPPDTDTPQLAYDRQHQPPETHILNGLAKAMPVETVAARIIRDIAAGKYMIMPSFDSKFLFFLASWLGSSVFPILDLIISRSRRNHKLES